MNGFPSREIVEYIRAKYPVGSRVELIEMDDPYVHMTAGICGTVVSVDDIATVHIRWDNGRMLGAAYGVDQIRKIR